MNAASLAAQEAARQNNGRFGSQLHGEMAGGTGVLGATVNLSKDPDPEIGPRDDWQAPVPDFTAPERSAEFYAAVHPPLVLGKTTRTKDAAGTEAERGPIGGTGYNPGYPEEVGFQGHELAPADYPRVAVGSGRSTFEHLGGKVSVPLLDDIKRAQLENGSDELVIPVKFEDRYGASEQREVTVRKHGDGYSLALPTGMRYSDDDVSFLAAAGAGIAWACPSESKNPDEARRWANRMGLHATRWIGAASNRQRPDGGVTGSPTPLESARFEEQHLEGMRRWKDNFESRARMDSAREAAEARVGKTSGFFASMRKLRREL